MTDTQNPRDDRYVETDLGSIHIEGAESSPSAEFFADSIEYVDCQCGAHQFASTDGFPPWITKALRGMRDAFRAIVSVFAAGDAATPDDRRAIDEQLLDAMTDALAAGDLEGSAEVMQEIADLEADLDEPPDLAESDDGPTQVPRVPVGEAVADVLRRNPELKKNAQAVARAYRQGDAFALARSSKMVLTRKVQQIVADVVEEEGGLADIGVERMLELTDDFTRGYSQTVIRTNVTTVMTEGRFRLARQPERMKIVPAMILRTAGDIEVRRGREEDRGENHAAANGLIMAVDDPDWMLYAPAAGYG